MARKNDDKAMTIDQRRRLKLLAQKTFDGLLNDYEAFISAEEFKDVEASQVIRVKELGLSFKIEITGYDAFPGEAPE